MRHQVVEVCEFYWEGAGKITIIIPISPQEAYNWNERCELCLSINKIIGNVAPFCTRNG